MEGATQLADDPTVVQRILDHIDNRTTDVAGSIWREPLENYRSTARFDAELDLVLKRHPIAFCPSGALPDAGSYLAREAGGTPVIAVRGRDGVVRAFLNACSHRGAQVARGAGCAKALVCPYHGWTYGLDGGLRGVPHDDGFPGLDKSANGLAGFDATERGGVVFVAQRSPASFVAAELDHFPTLIPAKYRLVSKAALDVAANWKIAVEGFLEGYHIRATHPKTFFPVQYDNLNVIEAFGRNSRVAFPYRNVEALRTVEPGKRSADGRLTYVYHLFPNAMVATFPGRIVMVVLEPLTVESTRFVTYTLSDHHGGSKEANGVLKGEQSLVDMGAAEDRAVITSIQRNLVANPREFFEFGLFEGAIGHFHRELAAAIDDGTTGAMTAPSERGTTETRTGSPEGDARGTRQRFVDAAADLLSEGGYGAASVQAIAERVGVSTGALYRHFPSKAELVVEVFRDAAKRDLAALDKVWTEGGVIDRLEVAIAAHARRALRDRRLAWALVHEPVDALVDAERLAYRRTYTRHVARLLRQAIAAGEIPRQEVELSAAAIVGALAEALVGPLSPIAAGGPADDVIVDHIVRFCRQAVGAVDPKGSA